MKKLLLYSALTLAILCGFSLTAPPVHASCTVVGSESFATGTYIPDDKCDTTGAKKVVGVTGGSTTIVLGTNTASPPARTEGSEGSFSFDLAGNARVITSGGGGGITSLGINNAANPVRTEGSQGSFSFDLSGNARVINSGSVSIASFGVNNVANPVRTEGTTGSFSFDLSGNARVVNSNGTTTKATAAAPTYTEGATTLAPLSLDLTGKLRTTGGAAATATVAAPTYTEGASVDLSTDLAGNLRVTGGAGGGGGTTATATAVAPSYTEGDTAAPLSLDLAGNLRTTSGTLLSGEDQTNNLLMTSGGAARTFTMFAAPVTTNNFTGPTQIIHSGGKTFMASVTGTGALTANVDLYGDMENTTTHGTWLCTAGLNGTTKAVAVCNQFTKDFPYYHATVTSLSGTSATVNAVVMVGAAGVRSNDFYNPPPVTVDSQVKGVAGYLQCIMVSQNSATVTAGKLTVYDSTAESGAVVWTSWFTTSAFAPVQICPQRNMFLGIYIGFDATLAGVNATVSYR